MDRQRSSRPAFYASIALSGGILLQDRLSLDLMFLLGLSAGLFVLALFLRWRGKSDFVNYALYAGVLCVGALSYGVEVRTASMRAVLPRGSEEPVQLEGIVDAEPIPKTAAVQFLLTTSKFVQQGRTIDEPRRMMMLVRTRNPDSLASSIEMGIHLRATGLLEPPPRPRNPGDFDYGRYLRLNDVDGVVRVSHANELQVLEVDDDVGLAQLLRRTRSALLAMIDRYHSDREASFLKGVLLAERGEIPLEVKQSFVDTGTIHILAVSGLNVGIVAVVLHVALGLLRLQRRWVTIATIISLLFYMELTGAPASVVRATIMALVVLTGTLFERKADIYNSLGVAAILMLVIDPRQLLDVGFQLSFAAVVSIVALYPILENFLRRLFDRFKQITFVDWFLKLFAVSLAAQMGTLPFTAFYFERVSLIALLANLFVVPISTANISLGMMTLVFSFVSDWIASCYAILNEHLTAFLLNLVAVAAKVPYAFFETAGLNGSFPLVYYAGVVALFGLHGPRGFFRSASIVLLTANALLYASLFEPIQRGLKVTAIDVGQGDAIFVRFPNGKNMLIDAGPKGIGYDAGERIVGPFLRRQGIKKLDAVVLSHAQSDHIGGIQYLLEHFEVGTLVEADTAASSTMYRDVITAASKAGVPRRIVGLGSILELDTTSRVYVLHPLMPSDRSRNLNNTSIAMKVVYGHTSMILVGDAEREAEDAMRRRYGNFLNAHLLKVGHHGGATSSTSEFVDCVAPRFAIISVGKNNKFKHPSPEVLQRLRARKVEYYRTDEEGAIIFFADGSSLHRVDWRNQ
jgi:competence protein ComEC